jgi:hypothetical protein
VAGDGYDWFDLPGTWEWIGGQKVVLQPGDPGRLFRSYDSLEDGFESHLAFLKKRYAPAWENVVDGDPRAFVRELKARGYFTADEEAYANLLVPHFNNYMRGPYYEEAPVAGPALGPVVGPVLLVAGIAAVLLVAHHNGLITLPSLPRLPFLRRFA